MSRSPRGQPRTSKQENADIVAIFTQGQKVWPTIELRAEAYLQHVAALDLGKVEHPGDLYLAAACALQVLFAVERLIQHYQPALLRAARRLGLPNDAAQDLVQLTFQTVLQTKPDQRPAIASYQGRGSLLGWLRTVLVRCHRPRRLEHPLEEVDDGALVESDLELQLLRSRYGEAVRAALRHAMQSLLPEERRLLRQHHLDGVTIDELAKLMGAHRATAARRVARIRDKLLLCMRDVLIQQLNVGPSTLDSIVRATRVDLTPSIVQALETK